jgi:hypothetical protein
MNDEELRAAYQASLSHPRDPSRADCTAPEQLAAVADQSLPDAERERVLSHVAGCARCRDDLNVLRAVERAGRETAATTGVVDLSARRRHPWRRALAAAAVLLVASGVWSTLREGERPADVARGEAPVRLVGPAGDVPSATPLRWHLVPDASRYEVSVLNAGGQAVFEATTTDTVVALPDSTQFVPRADYYWTVRAVLQDGSGREAPPTRFRLVAP